MRKETVAFRCHQCLKCCIEPICLPTPKDVIRIVRETGLKPLDFLEFIGPEDISEVAPEDPSWLKCGGRKHLIALRRDPDKGCHFLDKARRACRIYPVRPILCRLFPFRVIDGTDGTDGTVAGFTLHEDVCCPLHRDGSHEVTDLTELYEEDSGHQDDYHALVRVFNRKRYEGKKPEDFIGMFIVYGENKRNIGKREFKSKRG